MRKKFTDQEKEILLKNKNILNVSDRNIKYSPEFKVKAVKEYYAGNTPQIIFLNAEFDIDLIGRKTPERCLRRWRNTYKKSGELGLLEDQRGKGAGRPKTKELSLEEKVKYLESRNAYLEAENEFLKKLKALERGLI
jgi:transposase-like protein